MCLGEKEKGGKKEKSPRLKFRVDKRGGGKEEGKKSRTTPTSRTSSLSTTTKKERIHLDLELLELTQGKGGERGG